jgi:hypothetical protein
MPISQIRMGKAGSRAQNFLPGKSGIEGGG